MAENNKTANYGFTIFPDTDDIANLTFKEFRTLLAGYGENPETFSTIQQIDAMLYSAVQRFDEESEVAKAYTDNEIAKLKKLINELENGNAITIGRVQDDEDGIRKPLEFYDDTSISVLEGGKFTVGGVATDYIDLGNYAIEYKPDNDHLQIFYKGGEE